MIDERWTTTPDEAVEAAMVATKNLALELPEREHIDPSDIEVIPPDDAGGYLEPWGRLNDESDRAWEYFREYRDMGSTRTIAQIAESRDLNPKTLRNHYSGRFRWVDRCKAYDLHLDRVYRTELETAIRDMADRHANVMVEGIEVLTAPFIALAKRMEDDEMFWDDLSKSSIAKLIDLAQRSGKVIPTMMSTERLSRGLPTEIRRVEGEIQHDHIHELDAGRLVRIVEALEGAGALDGPLEAGELEPVADAEDDGVREVEAD